MAKKKGQTIVTLECSECHRRNYVTQKNRMNTTERLQLNKYCRSCRRHTLHRETK